MLLRTHLAIGLAAALYFLPHITHKASFVPAVLIASALPELGKMFSSKGIIKILRVLKSPQPLGGITRTYTVCILVSLALAFTYPFLAFPFFLGYSFNLFINAFTPDGITPFWPLKKKSTGRVSPGSTIDYTIFIIFLFFDVALFIKLFL